MSRILNRLYGITDAKLAEIFGYKDAISFSNSNRRKPIKQSVIELLAYVKKKEAEELELYIENKKKKRSE